MKTKEEIYDEQISPLMAQIITICNEHKIANLCTFALDVEEDLYCTTAMIGDEYEAPEAYSQMYDLLRPPAVSMSTITVTKEDGSKEITVML